MTAAAVSAVVVVHGAPAATVDACVRSLLASVGVDIRVVLVDNASPDGGAACRSWEGVDGVTVIYSARNDGFAAGVNQGLRRVRRGDSLLLLNDDATVEPDAVAVLARLLESSDAIAVAPRVMLANETDRIDSLGLALRPNGEAFNAYIGQPWRDQVADGAEILGPCFGAALFSADAFDPSDGVGPIDERYRLYYEDVDWVVRSRQLGRRSLIATSAVVHHQHAASTRTLGEARRYELVQRNLLLFAAKNLPLGLAARVWLSRLVVHAKGTITGPYRVQRVRSIVRALLGLPSALRARRAPERGIDTAWFTYANDLSPNFSSETYTSLD